MLELLKAKNDIHAIHNSILKRVVAAKQAQYDERSDLGHVMPSTLILVETLDDLLAEARAKLDDYEIRVQLAEDGMRDELYDRNRTAQEVEEGLRDESIFDKEWKLSETMTFDEDLIAVPV